MAKVLSLFMKLLGLTGGVGMGKTTCASLLSARGVPITDTDDLAREVVEPGQPGLIELRKAFGPTFVGPDGRLLRKKLAQLVFADTAARQRLESILHPLIRNLWQAQLERWRKEERSLGVVVIPLLFETRAEAELDVTVCVACSPGSQRDRLRSRGWSSDQIEQRIRSQWPIEEKLLRSTFVIWTEGSLDVHAAQLDRILSRLRPHALSSLLPP